MTENENENGGKELFNRMVKAGQRTYFVSVKEARNGNKYMTITESKRAENGKFDRARMFIFQNKMGEFVQALQEASLVAV